MTDSKKGEVMRGEGSDVVTLCGTQGCCPTIDFTDPKTAVITDDNGGKVTLTRTELAELVQAAQARG